MVYSYKSAVNIIGGEKLYMYKTEDENNSTA